MITAGTFETVKCCYGNHEPEVKQRYFSSGWALHNEVRPQYETRPSTGGDVYSYLTFVAGADAKPVNIDYPNASKCR